jgi:F-type H+-transporting ATPase subunit b
MTPLDPSLVTASVPTGPLPALLASVTVDLDKSVLVQMALFGLLILLLDPLLFRPMLRLFALREQRTDGARAEARAMQERAAELLANYESEVARIKATAGAERDALRRETAALEASMLAEARAAADLVLAQGRKRIDDDYARVRDDLQAKKDELVRGIGARVLGRELSS